MAKAIREFEKLVETLRRQEELLARIASAKEDLPSAAAAAADYLASREPPSWANVDLQLRRPRVGVGVVLTREDMPGRVLLGERMGSHGAGRFALPGGHLEAGEPWSLCALREIQEETGLLLSEDRYSFVGVTNDVMEAEGLHYITLFLRAHLTAAEASAIINGEPDKCKGWEWLTWPEVETKHLFVPMQNFLAAKLYALVE